MVLPRSVFTDRLRDHVQLMWEEIPGQTGLKTTKQDKINNRNVSSRTKPMINRRIEQYYGGLITTKRRNKAWD